MSSSPAAASRSAAYSRTVSSKRNASCGSAPSSASSVSHSCQPHHAGGQDQALPPKRKQPLQRLTSLLSPRGHGVLSSHRGSDIGGDRSNSVEGDAAREDAEAAEKALLLLAEQVIAPPNRRFEAALSL